MKQRCNKNIRTYERILERAGTWHTTDGVDGSYQMCTTTELYEYLIRMAKQPRKHVLTDVLLETLSIIAYKQPITKSEIEKIRGVSCDHAVSKLVEYSLVTELGRLDAPGRQCSLEQRKNFYVRLAYLQLKNCQLLHGSGGRV